VDGLNSALRRRRTEERRDFTFRAPKRDRGSSGGSGWMDGTAPAARHGPWGRGAERSIHQMEQAIGTENSL
jgi:hypothetical protein